MRNAVIYLRVSTKEQASNGTGLDRQLEVCSDFLQREQGVLPIGIESYADEGVSGSVACGQRPAFAEMFAALIEDPADCRHIVIERADRLARDLIESELIIRACKEHGIKIWCADTGDELVFSPDQDPTRVLIRQIMGALSQWEKSVIVKKLQDGRKRKIRETGRCGGRLPYDNLKVIDWICSMRNSEDMSFGKITGRLNEALVPPPTPGGGWDRRTVKRIFQRATS